jgi:hypothetical protein
MEGMHAEIILWHVSLFAYIRFVNTSSQIYHEELVKYLYDFVFQMFDDI